VSKTAEDPASAKVVVPVLLYHHVVPNPSNFIAISPDTFERQMKYLKDNGFESITQAQMSEFIYKGAALPAKPVLITFDDGRQNQWDNAVPIMKKYGFTATFFVVQNWTKSNSDTTMNAAKLRKLADQGFDIGSHTISHRPMQSWKGETKPAYYKRLTKQAVASKAYIEKASGKPCIAMAYPAGYFDTWTGDLLADNGYQLGYTVVPGVNTFGGQSPFKLRRTDIGRGTSFSSFVGWLTKKTAAPEAQR
jgi:peptidoglycan/xylan/chitin deacetylase (PgdA/CDA1 family)